MLGDNSSRAVRAPACGDAGSARRSGAGRPDPQRAARGSRGGRLPGFDAEDYKAAHLRRTFVERALNKLKGHFAVTIRYDKQDFIFGGTIDVASIRIWLRDPVHDPRDRLESHLPIAPPSSPGHVPALRRQLEPLLEAVRLEPRRQPRDLAPMPAAETALS